MRKDHETKSNNSLSNNYRSNNNNEQLPAPVIQRQMLDLSRDNDWTPNNNQRLNIMTHDGQTASRYTNNNTAHHHAQSTLHRTPIFQPLLTNEATHSTGQQKIKALPDTTALRNALQKSYAVMSTIEMPDCFQKKTSRSLSIKNCFVELAMVRKAEEVGEHPLLPTQWAGIQSRIPSELLMSQFDEEKAPNKVLVLGAPGTGKSTLCQRLVYQWSQQAWGKDYQLVLSLKLKSIKTHWRFIETHSLKLAAWLHQECLAEEHRTVVTIEQLHRLLYDPQTNCLLILDGLDEVASLLNSQQPQSNVLKSALAYRRLLMTSRPGYLAMDFSQHHKVERQVHNLGFSYNKIEQYIRHYFEHQFKQQQSQRLLDHLYKTPQLYQMARIPFVLYLLCEQWELNSSKQSVTTPLTSLTELYQEFYKELKSGYQQRTDKNSSGNLSAKEPLNLEECLKILEIVAYRSLTENPQTPRNIITRRELLNALYSLVKKSPQYLESDFEHNALQQLYKTGLIHTTDI